MMSRSQQFVPFITLCLLGLAGCSHSATTVNAAAPETVPVRAVLATQLDVPLELAGVGTVEPVSSVDVKARVSGQISSVQFREGADIRKGQVLFSINPDMLQHQAAAQQADIRRDNAAAQQARDMVARDAATQRQSQSEAQIAERLASEGILSRQRADQIATTSAAAMATLHADQSAASSASAGMEADRARLAQTQLQLRLAKVTAPISGRSGAVLLKVGDIVREQETTLVRLVQIAPVSVSFGIPEQALPEVQRLNSTGALTVEASFDDGSVVRGSLSFIDNTISAATGTIKLKATFQNRDRQLWPGEFIKVRLRLRVDAAQTVVPSVSIQAAQEGSYVWAVKDGTVQMQPVTVDRTYLPPQGGEWTVLASGVAPGTPVITEGQLRLAAGSRVQLLTPAHEISR